MTQRFVRYLLWALVLMAASGLKAAFADPNALWKIVHDRCVPDMQQHGKPDPCVLVSISGRYAILKDRNGVSQFLLIPTDKITGIEDPQVLSPQSPDYFVEAWDNRQLVAARLNRPVPDQDIALAINSAYGRSQNQLHIHLDCVRPDVAQALAAHELQIGPFPKSVFTLVVNGHRYRIGRLDMSAFAATNLFTSITDQGALAAETIVVTGGRFHDGREGVYVLVDKASLLPPDRASGEELEDHDCTIAQTK